MKRVFIGMDLDEETRQALAALIPAALPDGMPGRPTDPRNWHLTVRFLGDTEDVTVDRVMAALADEPLGPAFRIRLGGFGGFPNLTRATVLWVGLLDGYDEASALVEHVDDALEGVGFERGDRPFRPHVTLSRIRPPQAIGALTEAAGEINLGMTVTRLTLFQSHLGTGHPRYRILDEFPLD